MVFFAWELTEGGLCVLMIFTDENVKSGEGQTCICEFFVSLRDGGKERMNRSCLRAKVFLPYLFLNRAGKGDQRNQGII